MPTHMMLSLDLKHSVSTESRGEFYKSLIQSKWAKSPNVDTVWTKNTDSMGTLLGGTIESFVTGDLGKALLASGVREVTYVVQIGNAPALHSTLGAPSLDALLARFT